MEKMHFHVDEFEVVSGRYYFVRDSEPLPKRAALREFKRRVGELAKQVGKFALNRCGGDDFPGAIRVARNHRIALTVTRCDCDCRNYGGE